MKKIIQKIISAHWFLQYSQPIIKFTLPLACIGLIIGLSWALLFAPTDALQGHSYRIMFIHVPLAIWTQILYYCCAVAGVMLLVWNIKLGGSFLAAAAPIGTFSSAMVLITGALWGNETWGIMWLWNDPRLLSTALLFLLYLGIVVLRQSIVSYDLADKACAVLVLIGVANLPIIKYSVYWWNSIHQKASFSLANSQIHPSMMYPLIWMIIAVFLIFAVLIIIRMRSDVLFRQELERQAAI